MTTEGSGLSRVDARNQQPDHTRISEFQSPATFVPSGVYLCFDTCDRLALTTQRPGL